MKLKNYFDSSFISKKHLDLGCGFKIKNPYGAPNLYGIDVHNNEKNNIGNYKKANLILDDIPFPDNFFSSVSAYDFIEHIPRQLFIHDIMKYPFINLMNEIYRVLEPGGLFFASTPVYPSAETFVDPTHVNFITESTHRYFTNNDVLGNHYGFNGNFKVKHILKIQPILMEKEFSNKLVMFIKWYKRKLRGKFTHLIWELEAVK